MLCYHCNKLRKNWASRELNPSLLLFDRSQGRNATTTPQALVSSGHYRGILYTGICDKRHKNIFFCYVHFELGIFQV